jgi:oxalate decarboxylase
MSDVTRRELLGSAAAVAGGLVTGPVSRPNGSAEDAPPRSGPNSFKFRLEAEKPHLYPGGLSRGASARNFPISKNIAGVSMRLDPGAMREMHWHANAAEWGFYLTGRARITIVSPNGQWETVECGPRDLAYIPRGYGHYIQNISHEECRFILVFDSGYFDEFSTFSVTAWMASTPRNVLAQNLRVPESALASIPKKEVYMTPGAVPTEQLLLEGRTAGISNVPATHRFSLSNVLPIVHAGGDIRLSTVENWPVSNTICGGTMTINPHALRELHWHPNADEWDYFIKGNTRITVFSPYGEVHAVEYGPGDVAYIPQGYGHYIENSGDDEVEFLIAFNSGSYEEISLTDWISMSPPQVVATNFNLPVSTIEEMRRRTGFIDRPRG